MIDKKNYFIKTFGCAANEIDSEKIAGYFESRKYQKADKIENADVVVINTCSVRESAENRVYGLVHNLAEQRGTTPKIILAGCMLRYGVSDLKKKLPEVDEFLRNEDIEKSIPVKEKKEKKESALVSIMEGCDNFCTYCVVPYARGREKSRPFEEIVCEVEALVKNGYREITLIGQNVNSYGKDLPKSDIGKNTILSFAELLKVLNNIEGLEKIKFLTSNPWDLTDDIIYAMKLPKVDKYLHLPLQSGDDEILKRMNRPYTVSQYFDLVNKIRKEIPEIKIGTDLIVGFPGEIHEQFENTVSLCQKINFEKAYISRYSPRAGTTAYKFKDDVSPLEKKRRWRVLEELINGK